MEKISRHPAKVVFLFAEPAASFGLRVG